MRTLSKTSLCSSIALATALVVGARPASAQVVGNVNNAGGATISGGGASVILNGPQTTIDWTATGSPVSGVRDFLPSGNTMAFSGASDFAVLNRVSSGTDMIGLNGTITSTVNGVKGGTVFFYNPNGIVVGGTAAIDVGSLGLTTSDPGSGNNWFSGFNAAAPTLTFSGVTNGTSQVDIRSGAQIASNGTNSFIAIVAPKITSAGAIKTDGDVALVSAEAATLSFSSNYDLYSIQVDVGTDVSDSLSVTGGSIGRNSAVETSGIARRAYLVTVPKNDATTLLISGGASLGFDVANSAVVEGNSIVLSSGRDTSFVGATDGIGDIQVENATFKSAVDAYAGRTINIRPDGGTTSFLADVGLIAVDNIFIDADLGNIDFAGLLDASVSTYPLPGIDGTAGTIDLWATNGHSLTVGGAAQLHASGRGGDSPDDGIDASDGQGGSVHVGTDNGSMSFASLSIDADGEGGTAYSDARGGTGTGGTIGLYTLNGGTITIDGFSDFSAAGIGGSNSECSVCNVVGGTAFGGAVNISAQGSGSSLSLSGITVDVGADGGSGDAGGGGAFAGGYEAPDSVNGIYVIAADGASITNSNATYLYANAQGGYAYDSGIGGNAVGGKIWSGFFAGTGSVVDFGNSLSASANAYGGYGAQGGDATAGRVTLSGESGALTVDGYYADLSARGEGGGSATGDGGAGTGGEVYLYSRNGSATIVGSLYIDASGRGGAAETEGATGGDGHGGFASVFADTGGTTVLSDYASVNADGEGGSSYQTGVNGGNGYGGDARVQASGANALMDVRSVLYVSAGGQGGYQGGECYYCGGIGGDGYGGHAWVDAFGDPGATLHIGGSLYVDASGNGSAGITGNGGNGIGGEALFQSTGGAQVTADDDVSVNADGVGGWTLGYTGGNGTGGTARIQTHSTPGSSILIAGYATVSAQGSGGSGDYEFGGAGGNGQGGTAQLFANAGSITLGSGASLIATGSGGFGVYGDGGTGSGGFAQANAIGASLDANGLSLSADGLGGDGDNGAVGTGGQADLYGGANGSIGIDGNLALSAVGYGGQSQEGLSGGLGRGGNAIISFDAASASLIVTDSTTLDASGAGGGAFGAGSIGGDGIGGWSRIYGSAGNAAFGQYSVADEGVDQLIITANGSGGSSEGGTGGNGEGGMTRLNADGAQFVVDGDLRLNAQSTGGDGAIGGNAIGFIGDNPRATATTDARVIANHGTIDVTGQTDLNVSAIGGQGYEGKGGDATAGYATIFAGNSALGDATITMGDVYVTADATGGSGGYGADHTLAGENGGDGGDGGSAISGFIAISAGSLNGHLDLGNLNLTALSTGGSGGDGGYGSTDVDFPGAGGLGGQGGAAGNFAQTTAGGQIFVGTESATDVAGLGNNGSASFGDVVMDVSSTGGDGGWGGYATTLGAPGNGGDAFGGYAGINTRGGMVSAGDVTMTADAYGGNAGAYATESPGGIGGTAIGGGTYIQALNRYLTPANTGTMTLGAVTATANAYGGYGVLGGEAYGQFASVDVIGADVTADSISMTIDAANGQGSVPGVTPSDWVVQDGSLTVAGDLSFTVPELSVWLQNGMIDASSINIETGTFIHDPLHAAPSSFGTITTGTLNVASGGDIIFDADLDVAGGAIFLLAPGSVEIGSATSAGQIMISADGGFILSNDLDANGDIDLAAIGDIGTQGLASTGNISVSGNGISIGGPAQAAGTVNITAAQSLTAADIMSGGDMNLFAGGNLDAGALTTDTGIIDAYAGQGLSIGSADSGADLFLTADAGDLLVAGDSFAVGAIELNGTGLVQTANLTSGGTTSVVGGAIDVGNIVSGVDIGLWSGSTINAGNLFADARIGAAAPGVITIGSIDAGDLVLLLGGDAISTGPITAGGELYIGNYSMFALGYDPLLEDFDPTPVLALAPDATGGNVAIAGGVSATQVRANAGGNWASGAIDASDGPVLIDAAGGLTAGTVSAASNVELNAYGGTLAVGNIDSGAQLFLYASGTIGTGTLHSAQNMFVNGIGGVNSGFATSDSDIVTLASANGPVASGGINANAIDISSGGATNVTGALTSATTIDISAGGNVTLTSASAPGAVDIGSGGAISSSGPVHSGDVLTVDAVGSVGLQSASATNYFDISGSAVQLGSLNAPYGIIDARGPLTVLGMWNVGSLFATSNDIAFGPAGSFQGQELYLTSTNTTGAGIGSNSGAAAGSFILDNGELALINAQFLLVYAQENASAIDLMIGNTTLAGGGRAYDFGVIDAFGNYSGRLRVTGQISGQNFGANDYLDLDARLMEVDAVNGGIDFSPGSDATLGTLSFYGERIHVAEASVLDKLALDPNYANRDVDLATAPTAAHNETTINVGTVNAYLFQPGQGGFAVGQAISPYSIYVQNMGSNGVRSGLLIADANLETDGGPGSVDMVLNGKLVDPQTGQVLSGAAARDAFVADPENDLTLFTTSSSINGCLLTGGSCFTPLPPAPPPTPQVEDLANQFVFLDTSIGDMLIFGDDPTGGDDEDEDKKSEEKNAIDPPPTVINGKPLDPQTPTDEPVSGSGNPALIGTGSNSQEQQ